ncbi:hypothetical protein ABQF26_09415 [Mycolicibacterium elephantis]
MRSAFAKLNRAKRHRDELRADVEAFRARNPHDWIMQQSSYRDAQDRLAISIVVKVNEEKPESWPVMVGDVLTNLRAALDHSIFGHAAARMTLTPQQERDMYFPILTDSTKWQAAQSKLAPFVDAAVLAVVDQSQPFHRPQQDGGPDWHPLAVLNGLVNHDKHRAVRTVSYVNEDLDINRSELQVLSVNSQPVEMTDGAVVATVTFQLPPPLPVKVGVRPDQQLTAADVDIVNGYIEKIELPNVSDTRPLLFVMDRTVAAVEKVLNDLQAAGC